MSPLHTALLLVELGLLVGMTILVVGDNRRPQSTFAWLLLIYLLPIGGMLIYLFFGRSWRAFAESNKLARQQLNADLVRVIGSWFTPDEQIIDRLQREQPASYRGRLLELVQRNSTSGIGGYNEVEVLQDAAAKYPLLLQDIRAAQHSIHLQYYIWTEDEFTLEVKAALIERAQYGVEVRGLYDAFPRSLSRRYLADLHAAGVQIVPYLRYDSLRTLHNANYRGHRKVAVIDGVIGYVGGMNLDQEQLTGPKGFNSWRDTHLRIRGESATLLQAMFATSWYNTTGERLDSPAYYPPVDRARLPFLPVQITAAGPDSQFEAIRQTYFFMIASAQERVWIQSPFFIPDETIIAALRAVAQAGVDVRVMCQPRGGTFQIPYRAAYTYYAELARAGCRFFLYEDGYFHAKTIMVDSAVCAVGTANMDIRSFNINYETMAVIYDGAITRQLEADFCTDLTHCSEFSLRAYHDGPLWQRTLDSTYRLASPLL